MDTNPLSGSAAATSSHVGLVPRGFSCDVEMFSFEVEALEYQVPVCWLSRNSLA